MLFTVTWLIVMSFMHITASASDDIKTTVTLTSVAQPTTYETNEAKKTDIDNIISYRLSEIAGTEDILGCPDRNIDVYVLDTSG